MEWWAWPPLAAGSMTGLAVIFKFLLKLARLVSAAEVRLPVLDQIAREFSNNGGSTLRDQLDRIEGHLRDNGEATRRAQETAARAETLIVDHLQRGRGGKATP